MPASKQWIVTTSGDRAAADVARELAGAGFTVGQVLDAAGIITGSADDAAAARVRALDGVTDVSPDQPVDIGPPDAPTTW